MTRANDRVDVYQGADTDFDFTIVQSDGYTAEDITGWTLEATFHRVRTGVQDDDLTQTTTGGGVTITVAASGTGTVTLTDDLTEDMLQGDWVMWLWRTDSGSEYPLVEQPFTVVRTSRTRGSST